MVGGGGGGGTMFNGGQPFFWGGGGAFVGGGNFQGVGYWVYLNWTLEIMFLFSGSDLP